MGSSMRNHFVLAIVTTVILSFSTASAPVAAAAPAPALKATALRTEYRRNPLAIAEEKPRLSWLLQSADENARGQRQTAYHVLVASSAEKLEADEGDRWDTGKQKSDETIHIMYAGRALKSGERAFWKVRVWNAADAESPWSEPATWGAGLLEDGAWKAKWIGYDEPESAATTATTATTAKSDPLTLDKLKWIWTDEGDATKKVPGGTRYFAKQTT